MPLKMLTFVTTSEHAGWIDDGVFMQTKDGSSGGSTSARHGAGGRNMVWNNFGGNTPHHAFTTGRPHASQRGGGDTNAGGAMGGGGGGGGMGAAAMGGFVPNKVRPKGPSQTLKLMNVSDKCHLIVLF